MGLEGRCGGRVGEGEKEECDTLMQTYSNRSNLQTARESCLQRKGSVSVIHRNMVMMSLPSHHFS